MPKLGMEPLRRDALVRATIHEIGAKGSLDVTVSQIAARAGVSSGLAHHYFGSKEQIFLAAMRHILGEYGHAVRAKLRCAKTPQDRLRAILAASFAPENFSPQTISAWLNFYVQAQTLPMARRLLTIYHRRLASNLRHALRPVCGAAATQEAALLAALIDGIYIRSAFDPGQLEPGRVIALADRLLAGLPAPRVTNIAAEGAKS